MAPASFSGILFSRSKFTAVLNYTGKANFASAACVLLLIGSQSISSISAEDPAPARTKARLTSAISKITGSDSYQFQVFDKAGKPVSDAVVAVSPFQDVTQSERWSSFEMCHSNEKGLAKLSPEEELIDQSVFVFWHPTERLGALVHPLEATEDLTKVEMQPLSDIHGVVSCTQLEQLKKGSGTVRVDLTQEDRRILTLQSDHTPLQFSFPVPAGDYDITVMSENTLAYQSTVSIGDKDIPNELGTIDLIPTRVALLTGHQAPELTDIIEWKNSEELHLADLKGNVVILDFWGFWCGPCVASMPAMMKLHDQYNRKGLRIVAVHVDTDEGQVVNPLELDRRTAQVKRSLWKGRDLPFPVALTRVNRVPYGPGIPDEAMNQITADYGVMVFPTAVLIDRQGKVVKNFSHHNPEDLALLKQLIEEK